MFRKTIVLFSLAGALAGCEGVFNQDLTNDSGIDRKSVTELRAGIWVDPNGCEHWIIDDGIEGYLSQRLQPNGKPVCGNPAPAGSVFGSFKSGSEVQDPF